MRTPASTLRKPEPCAVVDDRRVGSKELPNQRLKPSARGARLVGNKVFLSAAHAGRSLSAFR